MRLKMILLGVFSALTMMSCAPVAAGTSISNALNVSEGARVTVPKGQTLYVVRTYSQSSLRLNDDIFDSTLPLNFSDTNAAGYVNSQEIAVGWLKIQPTDLPAGWNIAVSEAKLLRETTQTTASTNLAYTVRTTVHFYNKVRVTYAITAPAQPSPDIEFLEFTLSTPQGKVNAFFDVVAK